MHLCLITSIYSASRIYTCTDLFAKRSYRGTIVGVDGLWGKVQRRRKGTTRKARLKAADNPNTDKYENLPKETKDKFERAQTYFFSGEYEKAIELLSEIIRESPNVSYGFIHHVLMYE